MWVREWVGGEEGCGEEMDEVVGGDEEGGGGGGGSRRRRRSVRGSSGKRGGRCHDGRGVLCEGVWGVMGGSEEEA